MDTKPVYVFAKWQIKAADRKTVLQHLSVVAERSREEAGNLFYHVYESITDANTIVLYEGYENEAALKDHRSADYFQTIVMGKIVPLLEARDVVVTIAA